MAQSPTTSEYARGALYGFAAVSIWAGFIVVARLGIRTSLTPWDIAAIRFAVSARGASFSEERHALLSA